MDCIHILRRNGGNHAEFVTSRGIQSFHALPKRKSVISDSKVTSTMIKSTGDQMAQELILHALSDIAYYCDEVVLDSD